MSFPFQAKKKLIRELEEKVAKSQEKLANAEKVIQEAGKGREDTEERRTVVYFLPRQ